MYCSLCNTWRQKVVIFDKLFEPFWNFPFKNNYLQLKYNFLIYYIEFWDLCGKYDMLQLSVWEVIILLTLQQYTWNFSSICSEI